MIEKLNKYSYPKNSFPTPYLKKYNDEIIQLIFDFKYFISFSTNKEDIDDTYYLFKISIKDVFRKLKFNFFKKYKIDESKINEPINYECNLEEFYNQLLKFNEKVNLKEVYRKKIEQELHEYILKFGLENLKELIKVIIDDLLKYNNYEDNLNKGQKRKK